MKNTTKDMVECGKCGAIIPISANKCPKCGVLFDDPDSVECWNCKAIIPITAKICPECGVSLLEELPRAELQDKKSKNYNYREDNNKTHSRSVMGNNTSGKGKMYEGSNPVWIVDFNMPFWSIVGFMIKVAIASIPAMLVLTAISLALWLIFGGIISSIIR